MSDYIGRNPVTSLFNTDTFIGNNGAVYTLTYAPGSANSIMVFIDGVFQMPGNSNAFTVANKTLTFTENVSSVSTIFVVYLGLSASIGTPSSGTVDFAQLSPNILPAGIMWDYGAAVAPTGWLLCDGAIVSRATYSALFTAIGTSFGNGTGGGSDFTLPDFRSRTAVGSGIGTFVSSFLPGAVNTGTDQITVAANLTLYTGDLVTYSSTGTQITGLVNGNPYFIIRISSTIVSVASTLANAQNGVVIDLTGAGTGTHAFTLTYSTRTVGDYGGEESHAMSSTELLSHQHGAGSSVNITTSGATAVRDVTIPGAILTGATGGNAAMNIMSPFVVVTKIIKT